jgi:hypothetical protein
MPLSTTATTEEATAAPNWNIERLYAEEKAMEEAAEYWRALSGDRPIVDSHATTEEELKLKRSGFKTALKPCWTHTHPEKQLTLARRWWTV